MVDLIIDHQLLITHINKIINESIKLYQDVELTISLVNAARTAKRQYSREIDTEKVHFQLGLKIKKLTKLINDLSNYDLDLLKSENLDEFNKNVEDDILTLPILSERVDTAFKAREYDQILLYLGFIINITRADLNKEKNKVGWIIKISRAPLYHGTCLALILLSLTYGGGNFGLEKSYFYIKKRDAEIYANSCTLKHVENVFKKYKLDFKSLFDDDKQKYLLKEIILEFDHHLLPEANFNKIEEGRVEFVINAPVTLKSLSKSSKKQIVKLLNLSKGDKEYKNLF